MVCRSHKNGEDCYDQIVAPAVKFLIDHITKHLGYVISYRKHVTYMIKRKQDLENTSTEVKNSMETNYINNKVIPHGVPVWLDDVENFKKEVESISSGTNGCLNFKMRYRAGRKACKDTERIEELIEQHSRFEWTNAPKPTGRVDSKPSTSSTSTPSSSSLGGDGFKSRDKPFNDTLEFLQQDKSHVIALWGMGGVDKTTMMKQLRKVATDKHMFSFIVTIVIGNNPNMSSIQNDIAEGIGGERLTAETDTARADSLRKILKKTLEVQKNRILLILDDVWERIEAEQIGLPSPLPHGLKLLLTSRNLNICRQIAIDAKSVLEEIRVDVLEEAEAISFFSQITGVSEDDHARYHIGCDIVKKCGELPLAIKLIASTLKYEEDYVLRDTFNQLKNNDFGDNVQEIIRISYEHIKKDEDKEIFLLCGLFPEDYDIPIEDLTRHAWDLRLLKKRFHFDRG